MPKSILVAPVGKQGFATVKALLMGGHHVHFLARNPSSNAAKELQSLGAVLHVGDLSSQDALEGAMKGVDGVFFAVPGGPDPEDEIRIGRNVIEAAQKNDVQHIVLSTLARTGEHTTFPGWSDNYPLAWYWVNRDRLEKMVRSSSIPTWTILRPAAFLQMFCYPEVEFLYPGLADKHVLRLPFHPDTRLDLIDVPDIAKFVTAAFDLPSMYSGKEISLAAEKLTAAEMAEQLGAITSHKIAVELLDDAQARKFAAQGDIVINAQIWQRDIGYGVDIEALRQYGIPLTPLSQALDKALVGW
jgi:uncharacterized protein YbjT (DUF2867 family)